jgi:hypothetical protein
MSSRFTRLSTISLVNSAVRDLALDLVNFLVAQVHTEVLRIGEGKKHNVKRELQFNLSRARVFRRNVQRAAWSLSTMPNLMANRKTSPRPDARGILWGRSFARNPKQ